MMDLRKNKRQALLSWLFVGLLAALLGVLGWLQFDWISQVSYAERARLKESLGTGLRRVSQDFNSELQSACSALLANEPTEPGQGEEAYAARYVHWRESSRHPRLFHRLMIATPAGATLKLREMDMEDGSFRAAEWPAEWSSLRLRLESQLNRAEFGGRRPFWAGSAAESAVVELPRVRFPESGGPGGPRPARELGRSGEPRADRVPPPPGDLRRDFRELRRDDFFRLNLEWLLIEIDLDTVQKEVLPELLSRHLFGSAAPEYQVEVTLRDHPEQLIFSSTGDKSSKIGARADATMNLMDVQFEQVMRRAAMNRARETGRVWAGGRNGGGPGGPREAPPEWGRWVMSARHRSGSLEAVVNQVRWRNLGVTSGVLLLMVAAITMLVRYTQRAQRLAHMQMEFITGVSHELKTPLTVIRTAGHNLGGGLVRDEKQVQRYGNLIREEAEKLTAMVEQVLRFANAKAGRAIGDREAVDVRSLLEAAISSASPVLDKSGCVLEQKIDSDLPPVLGDPIALKHAIQNLLTNAAKYGADGRWIGLTAVLANGKNGSTVEIRVADRGAGVAPEEIDQIFDPFYRGKKAIDDQIHGTGLGLSLVKKIAEAHEGNVSVRSGPGAGAEFVLALPTVPAGQRNEFANTAY
ncbi:sensor histidine kinase [Paludibaculum fermentans]|uniref:sensor histidine kinase n=1 Tax=Paludibaculum fermentans TaxID=1473598 RepID=UPI003EBD20EE